MESTIKVIRQWLAIALLSCVSLPAFAITAVVPEPPMWALMAIAAAGLYFGVRRK